MAAIAQLQPTISALRGAPGVNAGQDIAVVVRAGAVAGGTPCAGGGGYFVWMETDAADDQGTVIVPTGTSGQAWVRVNTTDRVPLSWFELDAAGNVDCTAQINTAISLAQMATIASPITGDPWPATCNAIVLLPPGKFQFSSLTLGSNGGIHIRGSGSGNTTLVCNSLIADAITITQLAPSTSNPNPSSNVTLEGLTIGSTPARAAASNGGTPVYPGGTLLSGICVEPPSGANSTISRVKLRDVVVESQPGHGVLAFAPELADMEQVVCQGNGADGFCFLQSGSEESPVSGAQNVFTLCRSLGNHYRGFCLAGINSSTFFNCVSSGNLLAGPNVWSDNFPGEGGVGLGSVQEEVYCGQGVSDTSQLNTFYNCGFQRPDGAANGFQLVTVQGSLHAVIGGFCIGGALQIVLNSVVSAKIAGVYFQGYAAAESPVSASGTAGSGSGAGLIVAAGSPGWSTNQWLGAIAMLVNGPGAGQYGYVSASDSDSLTVPGLTNPTGCGFVVTFGSGAGITGVESSSTLIQNCLTDANVGTMFLNAPANSVTSISNGITQTWATRGGTYALANPMGATPNPIVPDPLTNGRECFITLTKSVSVSAPNYPAPGRKLTLIFTQTGVGRYSLTFASCFRISVASPAPGSQVWTCDLVCDGQNWIQTNPQAAWVPLPT